MNRYYTAILILVTVISGPLYAQSDIKLSLNAMNPMMYNPGYAGSYDGLSVSGIYSSQWVGYEGAPETQMLTGSYRPFDSKMGLGVSVINDQIGPVKEFNFEGNFAYTVEISEDFNIAMGLKGGINNFTIDYNMLSIRNPEELDTDKYSQIAPVAGVGFYAYLQETFLGISTPNVLTTKYYDDYNNKVAKDNIYLYATLGHRFTLDDEITLTPMALLRYTDGAPAEVVFMANFNWREKFFAGLNIEADVSAGGFAGVRFLEMFKAGYSYDSSINRFGAYNQGVHSIFLSFELMNDREHTRTPFNFF